MSTPIERLRLENGGVELVGDHWRGGGRHAEVVFLLHGSGQTRHSWRRTAERLAAAGWDSVAMDMRGHGDSVWDPAGDYSLDALVTDLAAVVDRFDAPAVLVGASIGGMTAAIVNAELGIGCALVLVDVTVRREREGSERINDFMSASPGGFASLEDAADAIRRYNPRARAINVDGLKKNLRQGEDGRWRWHWDPVFLKHADEQRQLAVIARTREATRRITVPTLVVRGLTSDVLTPEGAAELMDLMPHAQLIEARAGHMVAGDDNDVFASGLTDFLASLG